MDDPPSSCRQLGMCLSPHPSKSHKLTILSQGGIDALKQSIGAKICTPCPSNGAVTGTSGTGTVTLQAQSGIDQGSQWMSEFLAAANGKYTFDCLCVHWYGGATNSLAQDQAMIDQQMKDMASLASQYNIDDIVVAEMQRENANQEVRPSHSCNPYYGQLARALAISLLTVRRDV